MTLGVTQGHENVVRIREGVVLSQVSEARPGAPILVRRDEFSGQIPPFHDAQRRNDAAWGIAHLRRIPASQSSRRGFVHDFGVMSEWAVIRP